MSAVAGLRTEHRHLKVVVDWLLVGATLAILGYMAVSLLNNWGATDKGHLLRELALPRGSPSAPCLWSTRPTGLLSGGSTGGRRQADGSGQ